MKSLLDSARLSSLQNYSRSLNLHKPNPIPGLIVEIGVFNGGSLKALATVETERKIFGVDTFEGLPEKTVGLDTHNVGDFLNPDFEELVKAFEIHQNVTIKKGRFPEDFKTFDFGGMLPLVHIDVDQYFSTKECLEFADKKLSVGGMIVCDDYGASSCPGARIAINEFLGIHPVQYQIVSIVNCQIGLVKIK